MADVDTIIKQIKTLSPEEWGKIKNSVDPWFSIGRTRVDRGEKKNDYTVEGMVLEIICNAMHRVTGDPFTVAKVRGNVRVMAEFREQLPAVLDYMRNIDKQAWHGFLSMAVELLIRSMREWKGIPITTALVIRNLHRLPAAVDLSFPGYKESGMLNLIFKKKAR